MIKKNSKSQVFQRLGDKMSMTYVQMEDLYKIEQKALILLQNGFFPGKYSGTIQEVLIFKENQLIELKKELDGGKKEKASGSVESSQA